MRVLDHTFLTVHTFSSYNFKVSGHWRHLQPCLLLPKLADSINTSNFAQVTVNTLRYYHLLNVANI